MSYNTDLQNNNSDLQTILAKINNLGSDDESSTTETWTLTMEDGDIKDEKVSTVSAADVCPVFYDLDEGITSSNTAAFVRRGGIYETVLSSGTSSSYKYFDYIEVVDRLSSMGLGTEYEPDSERPWLVFISHTVPDDEKYHLEIYATLSSEQHEEWAMKRRVSNEL